MSPTQFAPLLLLALAQQSFSAEVPSAGSQLQQIPRAPDPQQSSPPELRIESGSAPIAASASGAAIMVNSLRITNAHAFSAAELIVVTGFRPGSELTLPALRALAAEISNHYRSHGYFLAQATVPAQDIKDGAVTIVVIEGQYGKVVLRNGSHLSDGLAHRLLHGLNSGDAITIAPLESRMLMLSDLPGVHVNSTLAPGASIGASDLIVDITPGRRLSGSIDADNSGSRYTGANRLGGTLNINNPFGAGDVVTLRALTSFDGLNYGRAAYQLQLGKVEVGVAYTALDYDLGHEFGSLDAHGTAQIASVFGRYPLLRSRTTNLYAQVGVDAKTFRDRIDITTPRTITNKKDDAAMLSLVGDRRDSFGGGGISTFSLTWTAGSLGLQGLEASITDAATARSDGHYDKLGVTAMRLQSLTQSVSLYAALQGQVSSQNLDVSQKMGLGGANAVRAYPEGEAYADQGYVLNVEARWSLPAFPQQLPGQLQVIGFVDTGAGRLSKDPWSAQKNRRELSGGGLGLNWFESNSFMAKAYYAHKLGNAAATSAPDKDGRFWLQAVKYF
jgi:hemolysin activation/secretion protein